MEGKRFIRTIHPRNILSYGPDTASFELESLNVLIGPNASGKSNLIDVLSILQAAPSDLPAPIRRGGGTHEWLWKGAEPLSPAYLDVTVEQHPTGIMPLRYQLSFTQLRNRFELWDEVLENERPQSGYARPFFYYRYQSGHPVINIKSSDPTGFTERRLHRDDAHPEESILSQRRDPDSYPELTYLARQFKQFGFYRGWHLGHRSPLRLPQRADLTQNRLLEDGSNLGVVLSNLMNNPPIRSLLLEQMKTFNPHITDITTPIGSGRVEVSFHEKDLQHPIPATRLSDGSLHYLFLLAVLCNPDPHVVTCIEEPELGLHPDIIPKIADLLVEASSRTQLIVTTHSDVLVDALTEVPESVVVCEKQGPATGLRRLDRETLKPWLERYRLGELWSSGNIGGNRW